MPTGAGERARAELLADASRSNLAIAEAAQCSKSTVVAARRALESAGQAEASARQPRPQPVRPPPIPDIPRQPDLSAGRCATSGHADWWTSSDHAEREMARGICRCCPLLAACREWALSALPTADSSVYAGMSGAQRIAERRRRRQAARLAELSAPGRYNSLKTHCGTCGLPYSGDNLIMVKGKSGMQRGCRQCRLKAKRAANRLARAARRQAEQARPASAA